MTMMMNTVTQSAAASAKSLDSAQPAKAADAQDAAAQPGMQPGAQAGTQASNAAQPFAAWLGNQAQAAALAIRDSQSLDGTGQEAAVQPSDADGAKDAAAEDGTAALPQDGALLAAMAMPLMPLTPVQVAQAVQAAQPSGTQPGTQSGDADDKPADGTQAIAASADRSSGNDGRRAAALDRGLALPQAGDTGAASSARPAATQADAAPAVRFAVQAQADAGAGAGAGAQDRGEHAAGGNGNGNGSAASAAAIAGAAASQPASAAPAGDTVKLAGPPAAWRQSLQEALGERMHVQVGKGIEQAVIRLEPPQLGRIDIAIRHSAGSLEVNISATNGEVLRQLQTVSDNLRSDLSQRQFSEVAVTVAPAPKNGAAPFGDPQQGRGRQQDRDQEDKQPGRALAEAGNNASGFSLGGRDHA
jgi:flagellar hook-length control protein FliK